MFAARKTYPPSLEPDLPLEIAHLLLIDVVGYSKLLVNEQIELLAGAESNRAEHRMFFGRLKNWEAGSGCRPETGWRSFSSTVRKSRCDARRDQQNIAKEHPRIQSNT